MVVYFVRIVALGNLRDHQRSVGSHKEDLGTVAGRLHWQLELQGYLDHGKGCRWVEGLSGVVGRLQMQQMDQFEEEAFRLDREMESMKG
jgi:hypothetical protein